MERYFNLKVNKNNMFIVESLKTIGKCKNENEKLFVHIIEPAFISKIL